MFMVAIFTRAYSSFLISIPYSFNIEKGDMRLHCLCTLVGLWCKVFGHLIGDSCAIGRIIDTQNLDRTQKRLRLETHLDGEESIRITS